MSLNVGDTIPAFDLPADGGCLSNQDLAGQHTVLYFYPKDDTSGCTKEAVAFRDAVEDFHAAGARIVGVSKDSPAKHDKFKAKHGLNFTLISDEEGTLCETFGVWVEKSMYGKKYMGIERSTFLINSGSIDGRGVIRKVWRKVKVPGHAAEVLEAVRAL